MANNSAARVMELEQVLDWLTERVIEGHGTVEFCLTENNGQVGLFLHGADKAQGVGDTVEEAIYDAMSNRANAISPKVRREAAT